VLIALRVSLFAFYFSLFTIRYFAVLAIRYSLFAISLFLAAICLLPSAF